LLRHSARLETEAAAIEEAVRWALDDGARTRDLARGADDAEVLTTEEMGVQVNDMLIGILREKIAITKA
jgi:3-isopropylmalate dehydrogenase